MERVAKMLEGAMCPDIHDAMLLAEVNETDADGVCNSQAIDLIARQLCDSFTVTAPDSSIDQLPQDCLLTLPTQFIELLLSVRADGIHADCHL